MYISVHSDIIIHEAYRITKKIHYIWSNSKSKSKICTYKCIINITKYTPLKHITPKFVQGCQDVYPPQRHWYKK